MIHLRMTGRVLVIRPARCGLITPMSCCISPACRRKRCGSSTRVRSARWSSSIPTTVPNELPELARLGIDPITDGLSVAQLNAILRGRARQLKPLLLDQHVIAGIGNIYCDEILHRATSAPRPVVEHLEAGRGPPAPRRDPLDPVTAIEAGGSTLSDTQYVDVMGDGGSFQLDHRVYDRAGQRCLTCGKATIIRTVSGGRSTCFCPRCQH